MESRKPDLIERINEGKPVRLAGGGYFLQQPIYSEDLAELMLSCIGNKKTYNEIFCAMGPDVIESRKYYEIIAEFLGVELNPEEVSVSDCLREYPELSSFFCHRIYDLSKLKEAGVKVPATPIEKGLERHIKSILDREGT
jgi:nucleoside-diphosphate-sugar epimerase